MGFDDSKPEYYMSNKQNKSNMGRGGHSRRNNKTDRRVYNNEDEQFRQIVEIFSYFITDQNKLAKKQGNKKNKKPKVHVALVCKAVFLGFANCYFPV